MPRSVQRALLRGLSIDPRHRFDSMHALLSALSRDRRRWVRRAVLGVAGVGVHRRAGRIEQALPLAERAVAVIDGHQILPNEEADARFEQAPIRWATGKRDEITRRLAVTARDLWVGSDGAAEATVVERRLVERSLDRR
ncbi:MAG: hypothetical protein AAGF11_53430 [Myxococcota bacterium]